MERLEDHHGRFSPRRARGWIVVRPRQHGDEERPAGKPDELHDGCENADHRRVGTMARSSRSSTCPMRTARGARRRL
jgi:hypothetical protein